MMGADNYVPDDGCDKGNTKATYTNAYKAARYGSYIEEQCNGSKSYSIHITRDCWISRWEIQPT